MSRLSVSVEDLVGPDHNVAWGDLLQCRDVAKSMLAPKGWVVMTWDEAPGSLKKLCNLSSGDEDWMALVAIEPESLPSWVEKLDAEGKPDVYVLQGVVIYVGSH